jgi:hypothetical protein
MAGAIGAAIATGTAIGGIMVMVTIAIKRGSRYV